VGLCGGKGIATFCQGNGHVRPGAKILQPVILSDLPRKGPERKEAYLLT